MRVAIRVRRGWFSMVRRCCWCSLVCCWVSSGSEFCFISPASARAPLPSHHRFLCATIREAHVHLFARIFIERQAKKNNVQTISSRKCVPPDPCSRYLGRPCTWANSSTKPHRAKATAALKQSPLASIDRGQQRCSPSALLRALASYICTWYHRLWDLAGKATG